MTAETKRTEGMKALTLHRPWSFAVAHLGKDVENRGWRTNHRGQIAIHGGKRWDYDAAALIFGISGNYPVQTAQGVVAVANLTEVHGAEECGFGLSCSYWALAHGWHWILADVIPLPEPVPCKGRQGLWTLPDEVERKVREQLGASE